MGRFRGRNMTRRSFRRTGGKGINSRSWFATIVDSTQGALTFAGTALIDQSDYQQANLQGDVRLETLYGHISLQCSSEVTWAILGILVCEADLANSSPFNDPDSATNLTDERWLWTWRTIVQPGQVIAVPFQVRARARLKDKKVVFVASNSDGTNSFAYTGDFRMLVSH